MRAYIDGSSKGMYGYCIPEKKKLRVINDYPMTNNQAEWLALIALLMDLEMYTQIRVLSDSQIVVNQLQETWETRNGELLYLKKVCQQIIETKELKVTMIWIPRNKNLFGKHLERIVKDERKKRKKIQKLQKEY